MPVVKLDNTKDARKLANYLQRDASGNDRAVFVSEHERGRIERANSAQHAEKDFQSVREHFEKTGGVQAHMAYISFKRDDLGDLAKPDGKPDWEKIEAFSHEYAQRAGIAEKHQYYVVAHEDKANPHVHLVWNAVSESDGRKYQSDNSNVERMRDVADALSREHGIKQLPEREKNDEKVHDKVIRAVEHGAPAYSWKKDMQYRIRGEATAATSWEDYKERLKRQGVEMRERGKGVSYSFEDSAGRKHVARGSRLGAAYTREDIERRFEANKQRNQPSKTHEERLQKGRAFAYDKEHFTSWQQELRAAFREAERKAHSPEEFHRLAQERGLSVTKGQEGRYELHYRDRFGAEHTAAAEVMKRGTTDQALTARIEAAGENPIQERQESAAPGRITGAAARGAEGVSRAITREVERTSTPQGAPEYGRERERERKRSTGNEDGMRSHDGLDRGGW